MPSAMSFALTKQQIIDETKTVTRRRGWKKLKPGQLFWAAEKCMGLKPGEKIKRLKLLRCVRNEAVVLNGPTLTIADVAREGFPDLSPVEFVEMFCREMDCKPDAEVQRIEFEYVGRLYSVATYDWRIGAYTPQTGVPAFNLTLQQLRHSLKMLRKCGYSAHRRRDESGDHDDNDSNVLVERTDGLSQRAIREAWKR